MKKLIIALLTVLISWSAIAQTEKKEIIIQKNGNDQKTITVQVDGDKVLINGMPADEFKKQNESDNVIISGDLFGNNLGSDDENINTEESIDTIAFLGVTTKQHDKGAEIISVSPESAAAKAGLTEKDIITKLGDDKITGPASLSDVVKSHKPDEKVKINFIRNGNEKSCNATLQLKKESRKKISIIKKLEDLKMPDDLDFNNFSFEFPRKPKLGIKIQDTENESGVKVIEVTENSPAAKAGIKKEDIIVSISGETIKTTDEAREQLQQTEDKSSYNVKLLRNGNEINIEVKIPKKLKTADL